MNAPLHLCTAFFFLATLLGPFCAIAGAAVKVGDKPQLEVTSVDGEQISLEALGGKMVAVHFWATWCPACMGEAEHMVKLHEKYGPKGLVIVGVSWDKDEEALKRVVRAKNFTWPHYRDAEEKVISAWGVKNTAYAVLISPEGKVLWQGLTWDMDKPLDQAFRQHPPRVVDRATLARASASLEAAEAALQKGDTRAALKAAAKVPATARQDVPTARRVAKLQATLEPAAEKVLAEVDPLVAKGEVGEAVARLRDLEAASGLAASAKAKAKLAELTARPDVKAKLEAQEKQRLGAERAKLAADALAAAKQLRAEKKHDDAYARFKAVAKDFADTPQGAEAAALAKGYEKDPAFARKANDAAAAPKAKGALALAQGYRTAGRKDLARKKYQGLIEEFPNTSFAEQAAKELKEMGN